MAMYVSNQVDYGDQILYTINFFRIHISVTVTSSAYVADSWLRNIIGRRRYSRHLVVGVGVQWNPFYYGYSPAHTLQLCSGVRCLIFQLHSANSVPQLLRDFLLDADITFVGLWNGGDAWRLMLSRHQLEVHELLDLRYFLQTADGRSLVRASVEEIVELSLGYRGVRIERHISMSDWDAEYLSDAQVVQATIDAYVSFLIGKNYRIWEYLSASQ